MKENNIISINNLNDLQNKILLSSVIVNSFDTEKKDLWFFIELNHQCNQKIWYEEDLARRSQIDPEEIVKNKRAIDKHNQIRNDSIEVIDEIILRNFLHVKLKNDAYQNSESAGSIIDRLSILSLKIFATQNQLRREDVDLEHINKCKNRLVILGTQRQHLATALDVLLIKCSSGDIFYKIYNQFKMYNDPKFNSNIKN